MRRLAKWFLALMLAMLVTAGAAARADLPSPFTWLRGNEAAAETKSTKWTGGRASAVVTKVAGAPKRLVTGTKNMLTPKKPAKKTKQLGTVAIHKKEQPQTAQPGFFGRLFGSEPEPAPSTVNEWLSQEKPKFGTTRTMR